MSEQNKHRLSPHSDSLTGPIWVNANHFVIVGMLRIEHPESDMSEDNPLPYGHTAFLEDGTELWICRAWEGGSPLAYLTVQTMPDFKNFYALHDWQLDNESSDQLLNLLLALIASAPSGIKAIAVSEARQEDIHKIIGPVLFDMHSNARLQWSDYERYM